MQLLCPSCFVEHANALAVNGRCDCARKPAKRTQEQISARAASVVRPKPPCQPVPRTLSDVDRACLRALLELGDIAWWQGKLENAEGFQVAHSLEHCHACKRELLVHALISGSVFYCFVCADRRANLRHTPAAVCDRRMVMVSRS